MITHLLKKLEALGFITLEEDAKEPKPQSAMPDIINASELKTNPIEVRKDMSQTEKKIEMKPVLNNKTEQKPVNNLTDIVENMGILAQAHQQESIMLREQSLVLREKLFDLKCVKHELINHPIFTHIKTQSELQTFMSWHVFAVWDFMSLTKRLQQDLTCTTLPWMPNKYEYAAHLINEIVLGEESDCLPDGGFMSHFGLYLKAMQEVGASTKTIDNFIEQLQTNITLEKALAPLPPCVKEFVSYTIDVAQNQSLYAVMGAFFYGRENVIPDMFQNLLDSWNIDEKQAPMFVYYLKRHIELDSGEHGPAAEKLIEIVTEKKATHLIEVLDCAVIAVKMRIKLWDGILEEIKKA